MNKYIIMPEGCRWSLREAANHESAYCFECSFYKPNTLIAIIDAETGAAKVYTREIDGAGNLKRIIEHDIKSLEFKK